MPFTLSSTVTLPLPYTNPNNHNWFDSRDLDVWEALAYTDSACTEDVPVCGKIRLLYLDETRDLVQANRGGPARCQDLWEREHVWPTSRNFKEEGSDGYTDLHHIRPADKDVNNKHSNYGYNHGGDEVFDKSKGCLNRRASTRLSRENQSFEPPDRAKGQVARMLFYMDVRYESGDDVPPESMPDLSLKAGNVQGEGAVDRTSLQAVGVESTDIPRRRSNNGATTASWNCRATAIRSSTILRGPTTSGLLIPEAASC